MNIEMQEKIQEDLEKTGFLSEMRAMIREHVYASVKSQQKDPFFSLDSKPKELESDIGGIACALIFDFLQQFNMNLTLKMLQPEGHFESQTDFIKELEQQFNLKSSKNLPLLFQIVDDLFQSNDEESEDHGSQITEDIESAESTDRKEDPLVESAGTSQGYDQSVNSLAMEDFDYVEDVKKIGIFS